MATTVPAGSRSLRVHALSAALLGGILPLATTGCGAECEASACSIACLGISPPARGSCGEDGVCRCEAIERPDGGMSDARDADGAERDATADDLTLPDDTTSPSCDDPPDGPYGGPCNESEDCGMATNCWREEVDDFRDERYVRMAGGMCWSMCDPAEPEPCGPGGSCVFLGQRLSMVGGAYFGCFDACDPLDAVGMPQSDNCDCRDGYECSIAFGVCLPGCSNDRECCEIWRDGDPFNSRRETVEVTLLDPSVCSNYCDRSTFRCVNRGCPGGECAVGDACNHDTDCPAGVSCRLFWSWESWTPRGVCTLDACNEPGRACPAGTECRNLHIAPDFACVKPCVPRVPIGESGCRDALTCHELRDTSGAFAGGCLPTCALGGPLCGPGRSCDPVSHGCVWDG